jgi:hypothetical protein
MAATTPPTTSSKKRPEWRKLAGMSTRYCYVELELPRDLLAHQKLRDHLTKNLAAQTDIELLGQFAPQLGFASDQSCLLLRLTNKAEEHALNLEAAARSVAASPLQATVRPSSRDRLIPGGIHVLRWFEIDAQSVDEFITLSHTAWPDFEGKFDAKIFGLFTAERTARDIENGAVRLLLVTRYRDHGVWETSRDPSTKAMELFRKRHALTRSTRAASFLLVAPPEA